MKYYLYNSQRYFTGSRDFPTGIAPSNGTTIAPNNESNQKWMGNEWKNVPLPEKTLETLKAEKVKECIKFFQGVIDSSLSDSAEFETSTWEVQRQEWISYVADSTASTPYVDTLVTTRGITKVDLMNKIGVKVLQGAQVQGTMHSKLDLIKLATTKEELLTITYV